MTDQGNAIHLSGGDVAERLVPEEATKNVFWEHVERYRFALAFTPGKRVLDIACGMGYGSAAILQAGAKQVIGMDISETACHHARTKYGVDARLGNAEAIDLPDAAMDTIVSFETIEHLSKPERFLAECHRVLTPDGTLVVSTPNRDIYHAGVAANPFHLHEMTVPEFLAALKVNFSQVELYGQSLPLSWISRTRGVNILARLTRRLLCPKIYASLDANRRDHILEWIRRTPSAMERWLNLWDVRKLSGGDLQSAQYLIAVARR